MLSDIVCRWESPYKGWGLLASALLLALPSTLQGPTSPPSWSVPFMAVKTFTSPGNIFRCVHISSTYSRQLVGPSIRAYVGHTFRFPLIVSLDRRPWDMIYFLKAMTNSFQTSISKVYFCKVCPAYASSKLWELISYASTLHRWAFPPHPTQATHISSHLLTMVRRTRSPQGKLCQRCFFSSTFYTALPTESKNV